MKDNNYGIDNFLRELKSEKSNSYSNYKLYRVLCRVFNTVSGIIVAILISWKSVPNSFRIPLIIFLGVINVFEKTLKVESKLEECNKKSKLCENYISQVKILKTEIMVLESRRTIIKKICDIQKAFTRDKELISKG